MKSELKALLDRYKAHLKTDPGTAAKILTKGRHLAEALMGKMPLGQEEVHLIYEMYFWLGDKQSVVALLTSYLNQILPVDEEAWARWQMVDHLAMLGNFQKATEHQKDFLLWARKHLPLNKLIWVMYDSTQATCWLEIHSEEDWLRIFEDVMSSVPATHENRFDRFLYLRTAAVVLKARGEALKALETLNRIHELCFEDPSWDHCIEVAVKAHAFEITIWHTLNNLDQVRKIGERATKMLDLYERNTDPLSEDQRHDLGVAYDNVGSSLFFAGQYELCIPLEQRAVELAPLYEWPYVRIAASIWMTQYNRIATLAYLRRGAAVCRGSALDTRSLPEFLNVRDDADFVLAASNPSYIRNDQGNER